MVSLKKSFQRTIVILLVNPILMASSNPGLDMEGAPYQHCFEITEQANSLTSENVAMLTGDCFLESAEGLMPYFNEGDITNSPSRADIIIALEYADSWYVLAVDSGIPIASLKLKQTRSYLTTFSSSEF
ncbi:MAG: hypothetical protein ACJAUP_002756 [Cellvibrionaceae bacterium]|jgi:hypothetical protein